MSNEFSYEIEIEGHLIRAFVEFSGKVWTELYGADADGNRGVFMDFTEVDHLKVMDSRGNDITKKLQEKFTEEYDKISEKAEAMLLEYHNET